MGERDTQPASVPRMVEDIVGCKWSLAVLACVRSSVRRPGEMRRSIGEISTKVLNERLNKMLRYGILRKTVFPESPPHVEYELTEFGQRFSAILDQVEALETERRALGQP